MDEFDIVQPTGDYSPITGLRVVGDDASFDVTVPPPDADGVSHVTLPRRVGGPVRLEVTTIEPRFVLDRRYAEPVVLPAAIAELSLGERTVVPDRVDTGCRDDLVQIDGEAIPVRIEAAVADLLAGEAVEATPCESTAVALTAGTHRLTTASGATTGIQVDRVVLADRARAHRRRLADRHRGVAGPPEPQGHGRQLPGRVLARVGRGVPRVMVGGDRRPSGVVGGDRRRDLGPPSSSTAGSTVGGSPHRPGPPRSVCGGRPRPRSTSPWR